MGAHAMITLLCVMCLTTAAIAQNDIKKVNVTVYYESLCPDSRKFINKQLHPVLTKDNSTLAEHVNLKLIPFGKAKFVFDKGFSEYNFSCHHGEDECVGNKIHACGLEQINGGKDAHGFVTRVSLDFIDCLMKNVDRSKNPNEFSTMRCATDSHVGNFAQVDNCSRHFDGQKFLASFGTKTEELKPPLKSVPTVVFNDVHKPEDSKRAQEDFVEVVCEYLKQTGGELPGECNATGATGSLIAHQAVVLTLGGMVLLNARL